MPNIYYEHIPVGSAQEASVLANEYTWTILDVLRKAGAKGLTAKEVHSRVERKMGTSVSASKIYALLRRMYEEEFIHRYYDPNAEAQRHAIGQIWGGFYPNREYDEAVMAKTSSYMRKNLFPIFLEFVKKTAEELEKDPKARKWIPRSGADEHCKRCHRSHEADEFVSSLLDIAGDEFVETYEDYKEYMKKMGYSGEDDSES
jgi:predicted transcriptional regulator